MYFNIFGHLFVIHIIIKSQGLINFLSVYVCWCVWGGGEQCNKINEERGGVLETYKRIQGGRGGGQKSPNLSIHTF